MSQSNGRVVTRVFCSKKANPHQLAAVRLSDDGGYVLEYQAMVRDGEGNPTVGPAMADRDSFATHVYCGSCRQIYVLDPLTAFAAAKAKRSSLTLMSKGEIENPLGVLRRKHDGGAC